MLLVQNGSQQVNIQREASPTAITVTEGTSGGAATQVEREGLSTLWKHVGDSFTTFFSAGI